MKGLPNYRKYPMGDVVNANLEPGEYVVRRNAVNSIGTENMELLNHADGAHGALNKLMVSASLVHLQPQDNSPVKIEANGFPIADSPVRQRVDATRNMQEGGEVERRRLPMLSGLWGERSNIVEDEKGKKIQMIYSIPAGQLGEGGAGQYRNAEEMLADQHNKRYYLGESDYYKTDDRDYLRQVIEPLYAKTDARIKMAYSPADSIPQAMVENYFDQFRQEEAPVETPKKKSRLRSLLGMQNGGEVEDEWSPTTMGGKLHKFLAERRMNKFMEQDPQLKAWYEQPHEIGTVLPAERIKANLYDTQSSINDKVLNDYSRSLSEHTTIEEGSPFEGVKFIDFIEGGTDKGRDMQYIETDKGRYRLAKTHQGGILDPIRNFFGEIPKRVDMDKPYEFETDKPYGVDSDRLSRKDKRDLKTLGRSENLNMQEDLNRLSMASGGMQEGGEVGKYEKALQKAEMMGDAGYALPESLSAPAEEMSNMRSAEDLYGMYMRMGPQMVKDKMSDMESRALDSLLQQKMNNMGNSAVPHYQDGGQVFSGNAPIVRSTQSDSRTPIIRESDIKNRRQSFDSPPEYESVPQELRNLPSDSYNGMPAGKDLDVLMPYLNSFGRMQTPLQEWNMRTLHRHGLNPDSFTPQMRGLIGKALIQQLGAEGS